MCQKNDYLRRAISAFFAVLTALFVFSLMTNAQTTAFTYRGKLTDGAPPAAG